MKTTEQFCKNTKNSKFTLTYIIQKKTSDMLTDTDIVKKIEYVSMPRITVLTVIFASLDNQYTVFFNFCFNVYVY